MHISRHGKDLHGNHCSSKTGSAEKFQTVLQESRCLHASACCRTTGYTRGRQGGLHSRRFERDGTGTKHLCVVAFFASTSLGHLRASHRLIRGAKADRSSISACAHRGAERDWGGLPGRCYLSLFFALLLGPSSGRNNSRSLSTKVHTLCSCMALHLSRCFRQTRSAAIRSDVLFDRAISIREVAAPSKRAPTGHAGCD